MTKRNHKRSRPRNTPPRNIQPSKSQQKRSASGALVDIIMPIFGDWDLAEKAIRSIPAAVEGLRSDYRLIVLDNGTPDWTDPEGDFISAHDQSTAIRKLMRPHDRYRRIENNLGFPGGCNMAAKIGRSPLICVLSADVVLHSGALTRMVLEMDDPGVGVVAPKLIFPEDTPHGPPGRIQHAGLAFNISGKPFHIFLGWSPDNPRVNVKRDMSAITGATFVTRRSLWNKVQGLDPGYGGGTFEDIDYCFSVRSQGSKVMYVPEASGEHYVGGSITKGANKTGFNLVFNEIRFRGRWAQMLSWDEFRYW